MSKIRLQNIKKVYPNGITAVSDANFEINQGEFLVLVGPSGCGKSTMLRMIAGLEEISSGDLFFDDVRINDVEPKNRDIGMVFQNYALYPHKTVFENIAFPLKVRKTPKAEMKKRVTEVAESLELDALLNRKPKELSGGQRQRVALGRAIIRNPKLFLFDEPLSNLDAKLRVQMRSEIQQLHRNLGTTAIYVTHDQVEAMTMGSRLVVMNKGEIQQIAPPQELYDRPANKFVAGFLGSPQMNFFEGTLEYKNGLNFSEPNGLSLDLPENINSKTNSASMKVTLGIRPEDIMLEQKANTIQVSLKVENIEYLGHEQLIYFRSSGNLKCLRTENSKSLKIGEEFKAFVNLDKLHFFDELDKRID